MRRLCLCFSFLLAALVIAPNANAQDTLKLNQTYRDVIHLDFSSGPTQIPLPPGEWVLAGHEEYRSSLNTPMVRGYLARKESKTLAGLIYFSMNTEMSDGTWSRSFFCEREDVLFMEKIKNYSEDVNCWAIKHYNHTFKGNRQLVRQLLDYVRKQNIQMPITMIGVNYIRAYNSKKVILNYKFNPEVEGISPPKQALWRTNDWHRDRIHTDPEKVAYVDRLKLWGRVWKHNVDTGFAGRLDKSKIVQPSVSPGVLYSSAPTAGGEGTSSPAKGGDNEVPVRKLSRREPRIAPTPPPSQYQAPPPRQYQAPRRRAPLRSGMSSHDQAREVCSNLGLNRGDSDYLICVLEVSLRVDEKRWQDQEMAAYKQRLAAHRKALKFEQNQRMIELGQRLLEGGRRSRPSYSRRAPTPPSPPRLLNRNFFLPSGRNLSCNFTSSFIDCR